jgi:hypothetical protein
MRNQSSYNALLPDWFSAEKYDLGDQASMIDWGLNLAVRRMVRGGLERKRDGEELSEFVSEYLALIKKHGFLPRECTQDEYDEARYFVCEELRRGIGKGLVHNLSLTEAYEIYRWLHWDTELRHKLAVIDYQNIFHHKREEPLSCSEQELAEWFKGHFRYKSFHDCYETITPIVCVDLDAPDEKIVDAFKEWLHAMRETDGANSIWGYPQNIPGRLSESLIARWQRNAILPYLDLELHQLDMGIELPMHVVGDSIFPATVEVDTTEAVRKTTKPSAGRALELSWTILYQAIRDAELSNTGNK